MLKLLRRIDPVGTSFFYGIDTYELLAKNSRTQPPEWVWHNRSLEYTLNSYGYRAPEFDTIDWSQAIVMIGCSSTFGVGLDDADTIPSQLEHLLGTPVINLGVAGASAMHMWALTTQLVQAGITPKACVYLWPGPNRVACFGEDQTHVCWGPWTREDQGHLGPWAQPHHGEAYFNLAKTAVDQQWPKGTKTQHWTWNDYTYKIGGKFSGQLTDATDLARDLVHPGIDSARAWAQIISKGL